MNRIRRIERKHKRLTEFNESCENDTVTLSQLRYLSTYNEWNNIWHSTGYALDGFKKVLAKMYFRSISTFICYFGNLFYSGYYSTHFCSFQDTILNNPDNACELIDILYSNIIPQLWHKTIYNILMECKLKPNVFDHVINKFVKVGFHGIPTMIYDYICYGGSCIKYGAYICCLMKKHNAHKVIVKYLLGPNGNLFVLRRLKFGYFVAYNSLPKKSSKQLRYSNDLLRLINDRFETHQ
jgi:hypothetical protein